MKIILTAVVSALYLIAYRVGIKRGARQYVQSLQERDLRLRREVNREHDHD